MNIEYELGDLVEYQRRELTLNEDDCYEANWVIDKGYIIAIEIQREISFTNKVKGYSVRYKVCPQFEGTPWGWNYATQNLITEKLGQHANAYEYRKPV
jgi:hypothetical protein